MIKHLDWFSGRIQKRIQVAWRAFGKINYYNALLFLYSVLQTLLLLQKHAYQ